MTSTPSTPKPQDAASHTPTGTWRHPRLNEINKRISATTFSEKNIHAIVYNVLALVATFVLPRLLHRFLPFIYNLFPRSSPYTWYIFWGVRIYLVVNVTYATSPLYTKPDDISDIPLTPSQRALLGLPPSNTPLTPGSQYITPPRYARSTPRSRTGSISSSTRVQPSTGVRSPGSSPLAGRGRESGSFSSSAYGRDSSPLLQRKAGQDATRRLSYGSQSPLGVSNFMDSTASLGGSMAAGSAPATPTPASGARGGASVGLNNKWLYERGRNSPSGRSLFA